MSFRVGIVKELDPANGRLRVTFPDRDQVTSWWLGVIVTKSQDDKAYHMPDIGEQVVCLMDEHEEDGAVLGAIYSTVDMPPPGMTADKLHWTFKDGASFEYDRAAHALAIALGTAGTLNITAHGSTISVDASGNVVVNGGNANVNVEAGGSAIVSVSGPTVNVVGATVNVDAAQVNLAGGGPRIARVGDTTTCPAGSGTITSGSSRVFSG